MIDFFFDFETRSMADLKQVGSVVYANHPTTEPTLLTWAFGRNGEVKSWRKGQRIPDEVIDVALHPEKYRLIAHNIAFDYLIWILPFAKLIPGLVRPKIENLEDCMALTAHYRVGNSLEAASVCLKLGYGKDKAGRMIMLKQCKPHTKTSKFVELSEAEWKSFETYGKQDTKLLREVYYSIPTLPVRERWAWEWTFRRNLRGIRIDTELVDTLAFILKNEVPKLIKEFGQCVSHRFEIGSSTKCFEFFKQYYPYIENMQAETVDTMLADPRPVPPHVRRALTIKSIAGSASIKKVDVALRHQHAGRIYGLLAYHEAHTKRWAGRGIQIQNFPRSGDVPFELNSYDLATQVRKKYDYKEDGIELVKNLLRRIWVPDHGRMIYCGDFSKIEPTVLFWLVGLGPIPGNWYELMAATIYSTTPDKIGKESEERQLGKAAALGSGYGMGPKKFKDQVRKQSGLTISEELARRAVQSYRSKYAPVVNFWSDLEHAFRKATQGIPTSLCKGRLVFKPMQAPRKGVIIRLPTGSELFYHDGAEGAEGLMFQQARGSGSQEKHLYGGLLTEHVVSAIARDLMVVAMYRLEQAGFDVMNVVHDEIWAQDVEGRDHEFEKIMCVSPSWCQDMAIGVGSKNGVRYLK